MMLLVWQAMSFYMHNAYKKTPLARFPAGKTAPGRLLGEPQTPAPVRIASVRPKPLRVCYASRWEAGIRKHRYTFCSLSSHSIAI
jgi:hypothetical protein